MANISRTQLRDDAVPHSPHQTIIEIGQDHAAALDSRDEADQHADEQRVIFIGNYLIIDLP